MRPLDSARGGRVTSLRGLPRHSVDCPPLPHTHRTVTESGQLWFTGVLWAHPAQTCKSPPTKHIFRREKEERTADKKSVKGYASLAGRLLNLWDYRRPRHLDVSGSYWKNLWISTARWSPRSALKLNEPSQILSSYSFTCYTSPGVGHCIGCRTTRDICTSFLLVAGHTQFRSSIQHSKFNGLCYSMDHLIS